MPLHNAKRASQQVQMPNELCNTRLQHRNIWIVQITGALSLCARKDIELALCSCEAEVVSGRRGWTEGGGQVYPAASRQVIRVDIRQVRSCRSWPRSASSHCHKNISIESHSWPSIALLSLSDFYNNFHDDGRLESHRDAVYS